MPKDQEIALKKLKDARLSNKERFHKIHHLKIKSIEVEDWILVFDCKKV